MYSEILEEFRGIDDEDLKAELLIEYGESFKEVPETVATRPYPKERLVPGCESEVYVFYDLVDGKTSLYFAVENPQGISAMALGKILQEILNDQPPEKADEISPEMVYELFGRGISMGKGQGLMNMVLAVKNLANKLK